MTMKSNCNWKRTRVEKGLFGKWWLKMKIKNDLRWGLLAKSGLGCKMTLNEKKLRVQSDSRRSVTFSDKLLWSKWWI